MPPNHPQISELEARGKPPAEAGSVPIVEAAGSFPSGEAKLSGTPFPSQSGGSSGGSPGQEGNFYTPSPPNPAYSFASPLPPGSGLGLGRIGDTPLPYPTLPADGPGQEGIGGPMRRSVLNPADFNASK